MGAGNTTLATAAIQGGECRVNPPSRERRSRLKRRRGQYKRPLLLLRDEVRQDGNENAPHLCVPGHAPMPLGLPVAMRARAVVDHSECRDSAEPSNQALARPAHCDAVVIDPVSPLSPVHGATDPSLAVDHRSQPVAQMQRYREGPRHRDREGRVFVDRPADRARTDAAPPQCAVDADLRHAEAARNLVRRAASALVLPPQPATIKQARVGNFMAMGALVLGGHAAFYHNRSYMGLD